MSRYFKPLISFAAGIFVFLFTLKPTPTEAQEQKSFASLDEVLTLAKQENYTFHNASIQTKLAELTKKTALGNVLNPRIPASMQLIDNTQQQTLFLPGEAFGQPGTFRKLTTGQKYSALINLQPQFDLFNLAAIRQLKSAKINQELVLNQNKINEKTIYNQINSLYFNILSFQGQIEILEKSKLSADTILRITQNRFAENVARKQEVNEAEVNQINIKNQIEQLKFSLEMQKQSLALMFENSLSPTLTETVWNFKNQKTIGQSNYTLEQENFELQEKMNQQDIKVAQAQNWPTLSFISSLNWQNLSNSFFYDGTSNYIAYNYVGLKLSMDLPTSINKISTLKNKQYQAHILAENTKHNQQEVETENKQLLLDYFKAFSQYQNFEKIANLKEDTYRKNFNQYQENIISLDDLLISYNNMLTAQVNVVSTLANVGFTKSKIDIINRP